MAGDEKAIKLSQVHDYFGKTETIITRHALRINDQRLGFSAHAAPGDAGRGAGVFDSQCAECHSLKEGKNKKGSSLFAVVGRKAATVADATYSDALKASGILWSPDKVDAYVTAPKKLVPGGKMKYDGLHVAHNSRLLAMSINLANAVLEKTVEVVPTEEQLDDVLVKVRKTIGV